jgi:hypothetical protein
VSPYISISINADSGAEAREQIMALLYGPIPAQPTELIGDAIDDIGDLDDSSSDTGNDTSATDGTSSGSTDTKPKRGRKKAGDTPVTVPPPAVDPAVPLDPIVPPVVTPRSIRPSIRWPLW